MNIMFRHGSEPVSDRLIRITEAKLKTLSRYIWEHNYEAQVHVAIERESGSHNSESMWRTSINFSVAGERFNANEKGNTAEKATGLALKELKREIQESQKRQHSVMKKETGLFKRLQQEFA